jgi:hypothetical protein
MPVTAEAAPKSKNFAKFSDKAIDGKLTYIAHFIFSRTEIFIFQCFEMIFLSGQLLHKTFCHNCNNHPTLQTWSVELVAIPRQ